ncbi:MAG: FadR family transcriptional regulator [Chloroflexi bacterium]|nr:FadR family transcriptional regulator [Chloroflexota bacterium]
MQVFTAQKLTLTQSVIEQILAQIKGGVLKPGDMLPSERKLISMFGVSRSCVREALRGLAALGYIEVKPGSGSVVTSANGNSTGSSVVDMAGVAAALEKQSLMELFEVRRVIESEIAALACMRASADDLAQIERALRQYEAAALKHRPTAELDAAFHQALARASHNSVMLKMLSSIRELLRFGRERSEDPESGNIRSLGFHKRIYEQIAKGDVEGARAAMREHIADVERFTLASVRF